MLQKVSDEFLIVTYFKAIAVGGDSDFIKLLEDEIYRRFVNIFSYKQKRMDQDLLRLISELKKREKEIDSNFNESDTADQQLVSEFFVGLVYNKSRKS